MEDYGLKLSEQSKPGYFVHKFIGDSISLAPDVYLFYGYKKLINNWIYTSEIATDDQIQSAERIIENNSFIGDCEDFAVIIMSLCRLKGIDAIFCLGKNKTDNNKGHVWIEVPICNQLDYDIKLQNRINQQLDANLTTSIRNDTVWLKFIQKEAIPNYELEYIVDYYGNLRKIE